MTVYNESNDGYLSFGKVKCTSATVAMHQAQVQGLSKKLQKYRWRKRINKRYECFLEVGRSRQIYIKKVQQHSTLFYFLINMGYSHIKTYGDAPLFHKKSPNMGPIPNKNIPKHGSVRPRFQKFPGFRKL